MAVSVGKDLRLKQHMCSNTLPRPWPGICPCSLSCQASLCCLALEFSAAFSRYFITAKAWCETEPFGLNLSWSHVVTPVCNTVELRSGLSSAAQVLERLCFNLEN